MKLPNPNRAMVDIVKLREYCLSRTHKRGRNRARVFEAALGLTANDAELLRDILMDVVFRGRRLNTVSYTCSVLL